MKVRGQLHKVTEGDREFYVRFLRQGPLHEAEIRAGKWDDVSGLQMVAEYRLELRKEWEKGART